VILRYHFRKPRGNQVVDSRTYFPRISIILPVCNEEKLIEDKLENMLKLRYPKDHMEMTAVDGHSNDRTAQIVKRFEGIGVKLIEQEERNGMDEAARIAADRLKDRNKQKIQRAMVIQESLLRNMDMVFKPKYKAFGMLILPGNLFLCVLLPFVSLTWLLLTPFAMVALASYSLAAALILVGGGCLQYSRL
jgi:glycosyltransferase involved in cell wall biosynthesis